MSKKNACYGCTKRTMTCHSTCEEYAKFTEENRERMSKLIQGRAKYGKQYAYLIDKAERLKKHNWRKPK